MTRKTTDGPLRNKERTKKAMVSAVGKILVKDGFKGLNVSKVAAKAKIDRKLIYDYFGGMEGLVKEYLNTRDFWASNTEQIEQAIPENIEDLGKAATYDVLEKQLDSLMENAEMRSIITWALCENLKPLRELNEDREALAESFFSNLADAYFKDKDKNFRAVVAILISANYYMTLISQMNGSTICGIDIQKEEDRDAVKKTFKQIIDWAYA
ncbi:TetR/AcrR family transcriptional regulator [Pedobacter sp. HDW13]|uniref:TetR/AcrR family transcriptional regulator n=1 Tax=unclassified Pedobacter TaxID=2628915 RepID=UPI000F5A66C5|nr:MULTISPECIES: TetR/AcrR family transcriptional regulator [unclassified Pedobacter]QIL37841.1 TetR/AcrR family transcriptional regulator [Pedobacter sp. HDW13]RQO79002.1 TetR/AcrR family transcriptional regulator [Pedobacter sp. KBW01]